MRKFRRRRPYGVKGRKLTGAVKIPYRLGFPLPQRLYANLRCTLNGRILANTFTNGLNILSVKGNSLFVPFVSLGSQVTPVAPGGLTPANTQPAGYHNFMGAGTANFYQDVVVLGSRITVNIYPNQADSTMGSIIVCIVPYNPAQVAQFLGITSASAAPWAKTKMLNVASTTGSNIVSSYVTTANFWGVPSSAVKYENDYSAGYGNDPVDLFRWQIFVQNPLNNNPAAAMDIPIKITMSYYCLFEATTGAGLSDL